MAADNISKKVSPLLLDVGGTFIKCSDGREIPIDSGGSREDICKSLRSAVGEIHAGDKVAVAIPGKFDYERGIFLMMHKFASVYGEKFSDIVLSGSGLTESDVEFRYIHDVNCMLLGEVSEGAAKGLGNTALVTLGTGLGFSMYVDGRVLENDMKSPLVSIYARPYRDGILEDFASKRGILDGYLRRKGIDNKTLTVKEIADRAREGDRAAAATFEEAASILGEVLSPILAEYGIRCLLFGGQISRSFDLMRPALMRALHGVPQLGKVSPVSDFSNATFNGLRVFVNAVEYPSVRLSSGSLKLSVSVPDESHGYYRGTRFDRAGVFQRIEYKGVILSDKWYDLHNPYRHDCLTGAVEEFSHNGYEETVPGGLFVKPGVGLLRREDEKPYDWFHRYPVADEGKRTMESDEKSITFRQVLDGAEYGYDYTKRIVLGENPGEFSIDHNLKNTGGRELSGVVYNHNFFTLGGRGTGPWTTIDFPFTPVGEWRCEYDSVAVRGHGFRFSRALKPGEVVYMSNVRAASGDDAYRFRLGSVLEDGRALTVEVSSDAAFHHAVFWGMYRVACIEPHTGYNIAPGESFSWSVRYKLMVEEVQ